MRRPRGWRKGDGSLGVSYVVRRGPVVVRGASAVSKFGPVELIDNDSERARPVPHAPFTVATYAPIEQTCPDTCRFKKRATNGRRPCFADSGFTGPLVRDLETAAADLTPEQIAHYEAEAIDATFARVVPQDGARGGRDLRLHVSGDARTIGAVRILARAAERWVGRGGGSVWTYTHAWRTVPRSAWGPISVLASVETIEATMSAMDRGYAPALTVRAHALDPDIERVLGAEVAAAGAWRPRDGNGLRIVPCPYETRSVTCGSCRLCLDRDLHSLGVGVSFAAHGRGAKDARKRLPVLREQVVR